MIVTTFFWVWLCALFLLPLMIIFKLTSVIPKIANLEGLELKPRMSNNNVVFSIETNYDDFISNTGIGNSAIKFNIITKILNIMCNDANNGKKYNPKLYLSVLKIPMIVFFMYYCCLVFSLL